MQCELLLVRHGETVWNAELRFQGQQNSPLTALGLAQADSAAAFLRGKPLHALYSSDLPRTLQTARPIAVVTGLEILPEPALRERNLGIFEGLTRAEVEERHAEAFALYQARDADYMIPNGESLRQLDQRGIEIMERLARRHLGERVAIVSHGAFLTTFLRHLSGVPLHLQGQFTVLNGSISQVRFDGESGEWTVITQGEVVHPIAAS